MNDQLDFKNNPKIKEIIENEEILLSHKIKKKFLDKLIYKTREINLLITNKSVYNLKKTKIKRKMNLEDLIGVTISNLSNEFIVHGIKNDYDNLYISQERKTIIRTLQSAYKALTKRDLFFCKKDEQDLDKFVVRKNERKNNSELLKIKDDEFTPIEDYLNEVSNKTSNSNNIPLPPRPPEAPDIKVINKSPKVNDNKAPSLPKPKDNNVIITSPKVNVEIDSEINELYTKTNVLQQFTNPNNCPIELQIYVYKKKDILFDSFTAKIGDSIEVRSRIIKKEKAEIKYTDSIANGNAAIFVSEDPDNENRLIINMGNIPPLEKVIFISKFINFTESSKKYELEIFRNLPILKGKNSIYQNLDLKGKIKIISKNKIFNIEKKILMNNFKIKKEKYEDNKMNSYLITYEIKKLPEFSFNNLEYIPSSKIYFELDLNYPIIYCQKSINQNENNCYCLRYRYKSIKNKNNLENYPGLYIFLIDQSYSMDGTSINIASKALQLFLQSLPRGSYYQIIGFGSSFRKYDESPKEYTKENLQETFKKIKNLDADLGGTNIYSPLIYIYNSYKIHDKINLPRYIFLLTDGEIEDKNKTLSIIEKNSSNYMIYSIGIGNYFDEDLIKNAGIIGKGNFNFCRQLEDLNSIIASEINKTVGEYIINLDIKSSLDNKNIIKNKIKNVVRENELINLYYITNNKEDDKDIDLEIKYFGIDKNEFNKEYNLVIEELIKGEELSKLIMNDYILNNKDLSEEEKIKLAIKYQIFTEYTSLFAEIELSEKITKEMKLQIIGDMENNVIKKERPKPIPIPNTNYLYHNNYLGEGKNFLQNALSTAIRSRRCNLHMHDEDEDDDDDDDWDDDYGNNNKEDNNEVKSEEKKDIKDAKKIEEKEKKVELTEKEKVMKMINTQDFIDGYWEENEETKIIKEKYQKEYDLLKAKNINDKVIITILVILFINKEHQELLNELLMIIKKAKIFIQKEINDSYENIIKEI